MEPQPTPQPKEIQLIEEFRDVAAQTSRPNAWAENVRSFGIKKGDNPIVVLIERKTKEEGLALEERQVAELEDEYNTLWRDADPDRTLDASKLDHGALVGWFLEKKGVVYPKEGQVEAPSQPPIPPPEDVITPDKRVETIVSQLREDAELKPGETEDDRRRRLHVLEDALELVLIENPNLPEENRFMGDTEYTDRIRPFFDEWSLDELLTIPGQKELVDRLIAQGSPRLKEAYTQYVADRDTYMAMSHGERYGKPKPRLRSPVVYEAMGEHISDELKEWGRLDEVMNAASDAFERILAEPSASTEQVVEAFNASNRASRAASQRRIDAKEREHKFFESLVEKAGLEITSPSPGYFKLVEKTPAQPQAGGAEQQVNRERLAGADEIAKDMGRLMAQYGISAEEARDRIRRGELS